MTGVQTCALPISSTVPHLNSSAQFTLKGNVSNLSGDMYPASTNLTSTTTAGGAFAAPTTITYAQAGVTTPLARNLYVSSGSAYFQTPVNIVAAGFGQASGASGPSLTVTNSYNPATQSFNPGVTYVLYKNGTSNQIEETAITNAYTGATAAYRIVNPEIGRAHV